MSYNLLRDTEDLTSSSWELTNCYIEEGIIKSKSKYFSISQELILPDPTKIYFRTNYFIQLGNIKQIIVGVLIGGILHSSTKQIKNKTNILDRLSVVVRSPLEKIKVCIIFESEDEEYKEVQAWKPLLCDLVMLKKSTRLKFILDRQLDYRHGFSYQNMFMLNEVENSCLYDFDSLNLIKSDIGSIAECKPNSNIQVELEDDFIEGNYYLAKIDIEDLNSLGKIYLNYNNVRSYRDKEQVILLFKAVKDKPLLLELINEDVLDYYIKLKHILIVDITKMNLSREDVIYLPFINYKGE